MKNIFTEHPRSIGETYLQHARFAFIFAVNLLLGGLACLIHAFFPFIFPNTGSNRLFAMMVFFINRSPSSHEKIQALRALLNEKTS